MAGRVGMVGLGLMGQAFAANLLGAGFSVRGFDIDPRRMGELADRGGEPAGSPAEAARGARWVLTSLPTIEIVREAALGPGGIAEGASPGLLLADATTSRPADSERLASELAARGVRFLDAAVSGTSAMAWEKDLIVVAGGRAEDFEACRPLFAGFARAAYHMGPAGSGALAKLIINLVLLSNRLALAEGLTLGMKAGMDLGALLTVLKEGAAGSKVMDQKGEKMIRGEYSPQSRLTTSYKDSGLMLEEGERLGSPMLLTGLYHQVARIGIETGLADLDPAALVEVLREMAGMKRRV